MATYNKRGYKAPKPKEDKLDNNYIEDVNVDEKDSTTAGVFNTLDATASKTEEFVERNSKIIFAVVLVVTLAIVGYFAYNRFIAEPKEVDATKDMFVAQQNFDKALTGVKADSLFSLSLKGADGKWGFVQIADEYSGTKAGNLANYYAGMAYLNTKQYDKAISYLEKFDGDDAILTVLAIGGIGDAHSEKNHPKEALEFYIKATDLSRKLSKDADKNNFTTPRFLLKSGKTALALGNKADALKYFTDIKENFETAAEAQNIDALIGLAQ